MSKWEMVRLGDLFKITSGGTPAKNRSEYYERGTVQWVRTGDLKDKYIKQVDGLITEAALKGSSAKLFPAGTVLLAMYGATIGACSILAIEAATNQACAAFLPSPRIDNSYLYYFLHSQKQEFIKLSVGGAQPNISGAILKKVKIPLAPLEVQQKIAQTLDAAAELISLRKQQLAELDNLIKALFYEMFGDPVTNEKGWSTCGIGTVAMLQGGFAFKSADYIDKGVKLAKISNVHCRKLNWDDISYLPECYLEVYQNFSLKNDDVLMAMTRPIIKSLSSVKVIRVSEMDLPCLLNQRVGRFKIIIPEAINNSYLYWFCLSTHFKNEVERYSNINSLQPNISSEQIESINIPLPPLSLQNQFVAIVTKIEEQKALVQKAIDESQYLFDSLMSEYFN